MQQKTDAVKRVEIFLQQKGANVELIRLADTARSAKDASLALNTHEGSIIKSLLFRVDNKEVSQPVMALISGDKKGNEDQILKSSRLIGKIKRPDAEYVKKITGFSIGGVSPLTISKNIPMLIDYKLNRFNLLWASAGHTHWVFPIKFNDLVKLTNGIVINNLSQD
jgi:prolyl-tRNA editing enzyme YbaK/EbsC (Cys-tRNA(Pro) deacylase)